MSKNTARKSTPRTNESTSEMRTNTVIEWISLGYSRYDILGLVKKQGWNIKRTQIDVYIAKAKSRLKELVTDDDRQALVGISKARFEQIFKRAIINNDLKAAILAEKEKNTLLGVAATGADNSDNEILIRLIDS